METIQKNPMFVESEWNYDDGDDDDVDGMMEFQFNDSTHPKCV